MPGKIRKVDGSWEVRWGGRRTAKGTTKPKAQGQLNLLRGVEHGWWPTHGRFRRAMGERR